MHFIRTLASVVTIALLSGPSIANANEIMVDRCSGNVAIPTHYNGGALDQGTIILFRNGETESSSAWTEPFHASLSSSNDVSWFDGPGHIRWHCNSTTGNIFDPGTWRSEGSVEGVALCAGTAAGSMAGATAVTTATAGVAVGTIAGAVVSTYTACKGEVAALKTSAVDGWTPERSRCNDRSTKFRARLGPDRLLEIECLGH